MVTAETAVVLPAVVAVIAAAVLVVLALAAQLRVVDLAGEVAREAAGGRTDVALRAEVSRAVPGATLRLVGSPGQELATVSAPAPGLGRFTGLSVSARASADVDGILLATPGAPP